MSFYLFLFCGFLSGVFGGMGLGGGTLLIPLLTLFCSVDQLSAQQTNLLSYLPMALFALFVHQKNGFVKKKHSLLFAVPALVFAAAGAFLAQRTGGEALKKPFGFFLCAVALLQGFFAVKEVVKRIYKRKKK